MQAPRTPLFPSTRREGSATLASSISSNNRKQYHQRLWICHQSPNHLLCDVWRAAAMLKRGCERLVSHTACTCATCHARDVIWPAAITQMLKRSNACPPKWRAPLACWEGAALLGLRGPAGRAQPCWACEDPRYSKDCQQRGCIYTYVNTYQKVQKRCPPSSLKSRICVNL